MTLALRLAALLTATATFQPFKDDGNMRAVMEVDAAGKLFKHLPRRLEVAKPITASFGENHEQAMDQASTPNASTIAEYQKLRFSTVRLQAVVHEEDILHPWAKDKGKAVYVGSGFVVRNIETGPLVITNAHVVNDARDLTIQVPANGQMMYKARVLLVNHDMDISIVSLASEDEYKLMKADVGKDLPVVKLQETPPKLGVDVVAMGYPLGVSTVKITKGILSGHEQVSQYMAYQQSAPISPGNSGGPLFLDGTDTVIGINFAAAAVEGAQAQNYAIPAFRVKQMLNQLDQTKEGRYYSEDACKADRTQCTFKLPGIEAAAAPGSPEIYERYGCESGIQITRTLPDSIFAHADPPIESKTFITSINGVPIDSFGEAPAAEYFDDNVPFTEHMFMEPKLDTVEVGTCACGKEGTSKVPLQYGGSLQQHTNVPHYDEVNLEEAHRDYEQFAGITVQPLSVNLVQVLVQQHGRMELVKYLVDPDVKPQLVVTAVDATSTGAHAVEVGDIVKMLNGKKVHTLQDWRSNFVPEAGLSCKGEESLLETKSKMTGWTMESTRGREVVANWHEELEASKKSMSRYPLSQAVKQAMADAKIAPMALSEQIYMQRENDVDGISRQGYRELGDILGARPVEERTDVRRGGKSWDPYAAFKL